VLQLPNNLTTVLLALVLGLVVGAGTGYLLFGDRESSAPLALLNRDGQAVLDRDRRITEEDTSGQETPDVEIRYDTVRVEDTLRVPVPASLPSEPIMSDRTPLDITSDQVTHSYYDPRDRRFEQRVYHVPEESWAFYAYALTRVHAPARDVSLGIDRVGVGAGIELRYRALRASLRALTTPTLSSQRLEVSLKYSFAQFN